MIETMQEFIEQAKLLKPENDSVFVHARAWIQDNGEVKLSYAVRKCTDEWEDGGTPEIALDIFRHKHYRETEPNQQDIKITLDESSLK